MEEEKGERMKQKPSTPRGRKQGNLQDSPNLYAYFTRTPRVARDKVKYVAENRRENIKEPRQKVKHMARAEKHRKEKFMVETTTTPAPKKRMADQPTTNPEHSELVSILEEVLLKNI